jgi:hypothetical protein
MLPNDRAPVVADPVCGPPVIKLRVGSAVSSDEDANADRHREKARTRNRAQRGHRGAGHWHVDVRSSVIVCRACGARILISLKPVACSECGRGALLHSI